MKIKYLIPVFMIATTITTAALPTLTAQATTIATVTDNYEDTDLYPTPRYQFVEKITASVYPSSSNIDYRLKISAINLTSFSGTATLYKETSPNKYQSISSNTLNLQASGNNINYSGSASSLGSGKYKIVFSGTVYTKNGSEYVSIENSKSY